MRINKRLPALLLSISLITSLSVPTMAAGSQEIGGLGVVTDTQIKAPGNGDTAAVLTQQPTSFSVTVPTQLPIWVGGDGSVSTATDVVISNNSNGPVSVKSVTVNPIAPWSIATFGTDFSQKEVGLKEFTLQLNGDNASPDGSVVVTQSNWPSILGKSTSPIYYNSDVAVQREAINNVTISTVTFILGWNTTTPIQSQSGVFSVQKLRREIPKTATSIVFTDTPARAANVTISGDQVGPMQSLKGEVGAPSDNVPGPVSGPVEIGARSLNIPGDISINGDGSILVESTTPNVYTISSANGGPIKSPSNLDGLFSGYSSLSTIDLLKLDTTSLTSMKQMFTGCNSITEIDLSGIDLQGKQLGNITSNCNNSLKILVSSDQDKNILQKYVDPSTTVELKNVFINETVITYTDGRVEKRDIVGELDYTNVFRETDLIRSAILGKHVTSIGINSLFECTSLTSILIPDTVKRIERGAFNSCKSLKSIYIPDSVESLGTWVNNEMYYNLFYNCESLESINVGSNNPNYTSVDGVLFTKDKRTLIEYPHGSRAESYNIPNSIDIMVRDSFAYCTYLKSVTIPGSVATIKEGTFYNCKALEQVNLNSGLVNINTWAFQSCASLKSIVIPDSVRLICQVAFYECTSLKKVVLPEGLSIIDSNTFSGCTSLESINIPSSVTTIGNAFKNCVSLNPITIPSSVTQIYNNAFENVPHIIYHGKAPGAPWKALKMN